MLSVTSSFPRDSHSCASEVRQLKTGSLLPFLVPPLANSEVIHRRAVPRNGHWFMVVMWQLAGYPCRTQKKHKDVYPLCEFRLCCKCVCLWTEKNHQGGNGLGPSVSLP